MLARLDRASDEHTHVDLDAATRLVSIGIDVGSATTHFAVSELFVGKRDPLLATKPEVLHRHLLHESPIWLTPFTDGGLIDAVAIESLLQDECETAGLALDGMDTGALICTGEAARKDNAAAISEQLAAASGRFVCATAGHHLEAVLGAHGSGAVDASRGRERPLVLLDVGGGTAKRTVISNGRIRHTAALNVGARLIAWDADGQVVRLEDAGRRIAEAAGGLDSRAAIAYRMTACLSQFLGLVRMDELTRELLLTEAQPLPDQFDLLLSGGLAEYFYGREPRDLGDVGLSLSHALRCELARSFHGEILASAKGIRATVIGAGQFTLQVSGETVFLDGGLRPPLRKVPVQAVPWDLAGLERGGGDRPGEGPCAFAFRAPPAYGYGAATSLAQALVRTLPTLDLPRGVVLVFEHNVARTVGAALAAARLTVPFMCLDELDVGDLEYLDVGEPVRGQDYLPVVVKSLVFQKGATHGH